MTSFEAIAAWFALPLGVLRGQSPVWVLVTTGLLFGLAHALLPGHGKALLAAHHLLARTSRDERGSAFLPVMDGLILAGTRTLIAFAIVVGAASTARVLGWMPTPRMFQIAVGIALLAFAAHALRHLLVHRTRPAMAGHIPQDLDEAARTDAARGGEPSSLRGPLVTLAFAPEPVALAIASLGIAQQDLRGAAYLALGLALGMGATLGTAAAFAAASRRRREGGGPSLATRLAPHASLLLAVVLTLAGAVILADAFR